MRKSLLLTTASLFTILFAGAQIPKGSVLLGGNLSASQYKHETNSNNITSRSKGLNISPSIGFVTKENTAWGFNLGYSHFSNRNLNSPGEGKSTGYSGGVFYRKYVTLGKSFYLFGQANGGYSLQKQNTFYSADTRNERESWTAGISVYPGITYAVSKRFHLEAGINNLVNLNYGSTKDKAISSGGQNVSTTTSKGFSFDSNFSAANPLSVGFRFVL